MGQLQAQTTIPFGDGQYTFALRCRELENLEKATGSSVAEIAYRVIAFQPRFSDLKHIIILGLEGGGMSPGIAQSMFDRYVDGRPLMVKDDPTCPGLVAARVMEAAWFGVDEVLDTVSGKGEAGADPAEDQTEGSTSPDIGPLS